MKLTLLQGTPKVTVKQATDNLRGSREKGRKALPRENWMAVMQAHPDSAIFRLDGDTMHLKAIPDDQLLRTKHHNALMRLCGLSLRELLDAMGKAADKAREEKKPKKRLREDPPDELGDSIGSRA